MKPWVHFQQTELAKKTISNDKIVRSNTKQGLKDFNSQFLATQAKKRGATRFYEACQEKAFDSRGDDVVELYTENESLKKNWSYEDKWLEESEASLLKKFDGGEKGNLITSRMQKQKNKQKIEAAKHPFGHFRSNNMWQF